MVLIFNNAATCHAYESGGWLSARQYEWEPEKKKIIFFFHTAAVAGWVHGTYFPTRQNDCSVIMLRRLLLCNFTPGDKQIKTYYLEKWSATRHEMGSFSLHERMISAPWWVNPMNISSWQGDKGKWTTGLSQRPTEMEGRQIIWLCATVNVWGSGQIRVEQN